METNRLIFLALLAVLFFPSLIVFGQRPQTQALIGNYPVKFGALQPGDILRISLFKRPYLVTGTDRMDLTLNLVVREDGRLGRFAARAVQFFDAGQAIPTPGRSSSAPSTFPVLADVSAAGMTVTQLQQLLERRIAENNYETRVTVLYRGSVERQ